jgi:hypothetical protein
MFSLCFALRIRINCTNGLSPRVLRMVLMDLDNIDSKKFIRIVNLTRCRKTPVRNGFFCEDHVNPSLN